MSKLCRALRLARTLYVYKEKSQVFILTVFISAHVVNDFYVTVLPAFLPALSDEFNLDYGELGILSLTFTLLSGVLQPILGHRADRYGQRRLIVSVGFLAGAVGAVFGVSSLMSALAQPVAGTLAEQMGSVRGAL